MPYLPAKSGLTGLRKGKVTLLVLAETDGQVFSVSAAALTYIIPIQAKS